MITKPPSRRGKPTAYELTIRLLEIEPPIWRRVIVAPGTTLHELHRIIQLLFEWYDYHLYSFEIDGERFEAPDPEAEGRDSTKAMLARLGLSAGDRFIYVYDFGDGWHHEIEVEPLDHDVDGDWLPRLVAGERRGPPEDCGGPDGFADLRTALADPGHPEHESYREWAGEDYDPEVFDVRTVRHALLLAGGWGVLRRKG